MPLPDPDLPLWQNLLQGDDTALDTLMERHSGSLFRFIYRCVLNEEDARDLLQETFVRAYFKRHQFQAQAKISTWLYKIAHNLCRDYLRSCAFKKDRLTESLDLPREEVAASTRTPTECAITNEDFILFEKAIKTLPVDLRAAFVLAIFEDRTHEECAKILGITRKSVENRVHRARKYLAKRLFEYKRP